MAPRPFFVPTVLALLLPLLWLLLIDVRPVFPLNFFFFLVGTNQFERHTFEFLAQEFARRGHKVVTVKPILIPEEPRLVKPVLHMVHEKVLKDVLPERLYRPLERVGADVPWRRGYELEAFQQPYWEAHKFACQRMLNSNLLELLAQEQIELAIVYAGNPCQLGLVHALGLPFVLVDLDGLTDETLVAAGAGWDLPLSAEDGDGDDGIWRPSSLALFGTRVGRLFSLSHELLAQSGMPALASAVSRRYRQLEAPIWAQFQQAGVDRRRRREFPDLGLMKSRAQLILANTDPLLESPGLSLPRRLLPIGGVHIDSPRPLFAPWNQSISSAEQGLILVSLGTQVDTGAMPAQLVRSFLYAFDRLIGHRIFWRLSPGLALPGIEPGEREQLLSGQRMAHLNITAFFPQNELLAHPRTRLLITNGGAHSLMEALHWGVPVLGIPLYGSNMANLEKAKARGLGLWLDKNEARDGQKLLATIRRLLDEPSFTRTAKELGRQVRSRPATAFERCLHALESAGRRRPVPIGQPIRPSSSSQLLLRLVLRLHLDLFLALLLAAGTFLALLAWLGRAWLKLANNCVRRCAQWWSNSSHRILAVVYGKVFCTDAEKRPKAE